MQIYCFLSDLFVWAIVFSYFCKKILIKFYIMITSVIENEKMYYDFKSLCNVLDIQPANRTRLGRLVKSSSIRVIEINETGKELSYAYTSNEGILIMLNEFKGLNKILKAFKLHKKLYGSYFFNGFISFFLTGKISDNYFTNV